MEIFNLPDLASNPKTFIDYVINNVKYKFIFDWQDDCCYCTAYFSDGGNNQYLFKGRAITINSNLIERIKNPELISGSLMIKNVYGQSIEPMQENFATDYQLIYMTEDELNV